MLLIVVAWAGILIDDAVSLCRSNFVSFGIRSARDVPENGIIPRNDDTRYDGTKLNSIPTGGKFSSYYAQRGAELPS